MSDTVATIDDGECVAVSVGATGGSNLETDDIMADASSESVRPDKSYTLCMSCNSNSTSEVLTCPEC